MPLQQISVSPLDWSKETTATQPNQRRQENWKIPEPVFTTSGANHLERCPSQASTLSNNNDICRICHCEGDEEAPLIAPCYCAGSLRYVHQACLQQWIKSSDIRCCELCKFAFIMQSKLKPVNEWEGPDLSAVERRKLLCSVTFHLAAVTCVVWSLYVLIERTADEVQRGVLEWPFYTKLIVVGIGLAGGIVFVYIQCKAYVHICRRWRAYNRVIYVQNAPEKVAARASSLRTAHHQDSSYVTDTCCGPAVPETEAGKVTVVDRGDGQLEKLTVPTGSGIVRRPDRRDLVAELAETTCLLEEGRTQVDLDGMQIGRPWTTAGPTLMTEANEMEARPRTVGSQPPLLLGVTG